MEGIEFFTNEKEETRNEPEDIFGEIDTSDGEDDDMIEDTFDDIDNW